MIKRPATADFVQSLLKCISELLKDAQLKDVFTAVMLLAYFYSVLPGLNPKLRPYENNFNQA